jgi:transmembrane sensor
MKNDIDNLLARYFGGVASERDMQELEEWISFSPDHQLYFDELTSLYAKMVVSDAPVPIPHTKKAKERFLAYISVQKESKQTQGHEIKHIPFYKIRMFQAAGIALFFMLSFSFWKLVLSDREMILATQMTSKQEVLSDQTQVDLSNNSKITYRSTFAKNNKIILLEGEANFKVGHSGKGRLQVIANETFIDDIGTVFEVTAYPDSNYVSVKVSTGQVHFYTKSNDGLKISAGETGIYYKHTKTFKVLAQKLDSLEIGSMHVDFQAIVLRDALDIISNAYKVNIKTSDESIGNRKITVNFDGEDVNIVLQIIAETLDLKLEKRNTGYLLINKKNK